MKKLVLSVSLLGIFSQIESSAGGGADAASYDAISHATIIPQEFIFIPELYTKGNFDSFSGLLDATETVGYNDRNRENSLASDTTDVFIRKESSHSEIGTPLPSLLRGGFGNHSPLKEVSVNTKVVAEGSLVCSKSSTPKRPLLRARKCFFDSGLSNEDAIETGKEDIVLNPIQHLFPLSRENSFIYKDDVVIGESSLQKLSDEGEGSIIVVGRESMLFAPLEDTVKVRNVDSIDFATTISSQRDSFLRRESLTPNSDVQDNIVQSANHNQTGNDN